MDLNKGRSAPENGSLAMCAIQPGAVRYRSTPPSFLTNVELPKIPIPCFVSQFPLKNSQFRYTGNFAGKSLQLLTDWALKIRLQDQNQRNSQYFPGYLGI